jgi:hypothetical protein
MNVDLRKAVVERGVTVLHTHTRGHAAAAAVGDYVDARS